MRLLGVAVLLGLPVRFVSKPHIAFSSYRHETVQTSESQVLANYLTIRGEGYCKGQTILELGSGTGLVGLVAAALGGDVWMTDQAFVEYPSY
jgi:predicted RNA methylase